MTNDELVRLSFDDAEALWLQWALDADDVLARAAFERTLRHAAGIEDDGCDRVPVEDHGREATGATPICGRAARPR